jgi:hypothetical protein
VRGALMFGFHKKTRGEMMRSELGESWDHFMAAAGHAANGVGQTLGPRATRLRGAASNGWTSTASTLAPLAVAYREGAADAATIALKMKKKSVKAAKKGKPVSNRRTGMLIGLLAAGVALGAAGALVVRRRRRQEWSEYDPTGALDSMSSDTRSMADKAAGKSGGTMDKLAHHTSKAMDKTADKLSSAASSMRKTDLKGKADEAAERANEATDKMASKFGGSSSSQNSRP